MSKSLANALPVVASFYSNSTGVYVNISGREAYTDGKSVVVPSVDFSNSDMEPVVWGFLAHECAHIKHTDFKVVQGINNPLLHSLLNIFEDARIEREMFDAFPRSALDIEKVIKYLISIGEMNYESGTDGIPLITSYLLTMVRAVYLGQRDLEPIYKAFRQDFDNFDLSLRKELDEIVRIELPKCKNTQDVYDLSETVMSKIEQYSSNSPNSSDNNGNACDDDDNSSARSSRSSRDFSQGNISGRPSRHEQDQTLPEELSSADNDPFGTDIFSKVKKIISDNGQNAELESFPTQVGTEEPKVGRYPSTLIDDLTSAKRECYSRLQQLILTKTEDDRRRSYIGRELSLDRMHAIVTDQISPNFIRYDGDCESVDTAFHIVCDISGSMGRIIADSNPIQRWYEIANAASYSISLALSEIPNLEVAVSYFPGIFCNVTTVLKPNQDPEACADNFKQLPRGTTPLDTALWYAAGELSSSQKKRKIMLVITDGLPDDRAKAECAIKRIEEDGIEIYAIGVVTESVKSLFSHNTVLTSVIDLKSEIFDVVAELLSGAEVCDLSEIRSQETEQKIKE